MAERSLLPPWPPSAAATPLPTLDPPTAAAFAEAGRWLGERRRSGRPRDPSVAAALLRALRLRSPPAMLHVVGSNGKGTVTHLLAAMAHAHGLRSGRFTSPHVEDLRERIAVDGVALAAERWVAWRQQAEARLNDPATSEAAAAAGFFEWCLALAVQGFQEAGVELAVVEAGVGARHDATMALADLVGDGVVGTVLTNVDLDHLETLGPGLLDIAADKAAVARPGVPLVTAAKGEALALIEGRAQEVGAPLHLIGPDSELGRWPADALPPDAAWPATRRENARLALAMGRLLGWSEEALARGLTSAPPPARFEAFLVPTPGGPVRVLLDGAHDPAAAARLASELGSGYVLLFAALARKQGLATLMPLWAGASDLFLSSAVAGEAPMGGADGARSRHDDPLQALDAALALAAAQGRMLVIAGSLYLAGTLRPRLRALAAEPSAMLPGRWEESGSSV